MRRTSRRSRKHHRKHTRRNRGHRRHRKMGILKNARRIVRNMFGAEVMKDVFVPVLAGTAGFIAARAGGNLLSRQSLPVVGGDPRAGKLAAAIVGVPLIMWLGKSQPMVMRNAGPILIGLGLAATEGYLRGTRFLPEIPLIAEAPPVAPPATAGMGAYYTEGMLGAGMDVSHYGAPFRGMLGDEGGGPGTEAVSIVTPVDGMSPAPMQPTTRPVHKGRHGGGGGIFARNLFDGMMAG